MRTGTHCASLMKFSVALSDYGRANSGPVTARYAAHDRAIAGGRRHRRKKSPAGRYGLNSFDYLSCLRSPKAYWVPVVQATGSALSSTAETRYPVAR